MGVYNVHVICININRKVLILGRKNIRHVCMYVCIIKKYVYVHNVYKYFLITYFKICL